MITFDTASAVSPVEQIRSQIAAAIRSGNLLPDTKLPPVRQLAADLRVAPGSVAKAYKELEHAGLIRTMRAAGTRVNPGQAIARPPLEAAAELARQASLEGLSLQEAQGLLAHVWTKKQFHPPQPAQHA
jgi:GntR family transcriptional regulator